MRKADQYFVIDDMRYSTEWYDVKDGALYVKYTAIEYYPIFGYCTEVIRLKYIKDILC
jgi:hypothetical protein